jgi:serine protease Do
VARAGAAILALLAAGLAGFLIAQHVAQIVPGNVVPVKLPVAIAPTPSPSSLTDIGRADLASVVTIEAELQNGTEESLGTGWIFDAHGDVVTNAHVVNGDDTLRVTDRSDHTYVARLVQSSASLDIALLRVTGSLAGTPLPLDSAALTGTGAGVMTLASSRATGHSDLTPETLAGLDVDVPLSGTGIEAGQSSPQVYNDMLHLQGLRIYEGNSGGPVLNQQGQVIGIVTLASPTAPDAYAIPLNRVLADLKQWAAVA